MEDIKDIIRPIVKVEGKETIGIRDMRVIILRTQIIKTQDTWTLIVPIVSMVDMEIQKAHLMKVFIKIRIVIIALIVEMEDIEIIVPIAKDMMVKWMQTIKDLAMVTLMM